MNQIRGLEAFAEKNRDTLPAMGETPPPSAKCEHRGKKKPWSRPTVKEIKRPPQPRSQWVRVELLGVVADSLLELWAACMNAPDGQLPKSVEDKMLRASKLIEESGIATVVR